RLEEGALFFDYDLDGDYDLFTVYSASNIGVQIWESYGDGTFFQAEKDIVDSPYIGLDLGESAEDWDNDGDIDFTTRQVFRRNMLIEEGKRHFKVATHDIPASHLTSATPAWGDWDKDGDLDCALGNWLSTGHFYENILYGPATPAADRRYVRVRAQRDSATLEDGLETDYGASVELTLLNVSDNLRRRKFTASSHGYLNQNEYTLHFALPADPAPADASEDVRFDVAVDFPRFPSGAIWRVDKHVNPALGNINLATLRDREIRVFRSGRVTLNGCELVPDPARPILRATTTGGLALPTPTVALPAPVPAPGPDHFVGLDFDTLPATEPMRLCEILLDGQLDAAVACTGGAGFNVALWDVTNAAAPVRIDASARATSTRNRRSFFRADVVLEPRRHYRLVARVTQLRGSPASERFDHDDLNVLGGLSYPDTDPCSGLAVVQAVADPTQVYLAIRFSPELGSAWLDLGNGHAGTSGVPLLEGHGVPRAGSPVGLTLDHARPGSPVMIVVGRDLSCTPLYGGVLVPALDLSIGGLLTDPLGRLFLHGPWPGGVAQVYFQAWILDPGASQGHAASNALAATTR
ncbi:MAG: VCBS repeat-containing protein, partial [Planctomycetota bacterium]